MSQPNQPPPRRGLSSLQFILLVFAVAIVPPILHQIDIDRETLKIVGRCCAGFAAVLIVWGMFTKLIRFVGVIVALLVAGSMLVSEGVLEPPNVVQMIKDATAK